jgi:hypothetical protein
MNLGEDYKFRDDMPTQEVGDTLPIELLFDEFKGVIYRYLKVSIIPGDNTKEIEPKVRFDYEILDSGLFKEKKLRRSARFNQFIGLILNQLVLFAADTDEVNEEIIDEVGTNRTKKSNTKR